MTPLQMLATSAACSTALVVAASAPMPTQAQAPARDASQTFAPPSGTGAISGTVRGLNGEPIRRARVSISGDMRLERATLTDVDGRYAFAGLPSGRFTVTAQKAGHPRISHGASRPYRPGAGIFLQEGQRADRIDLMLAAGAVLAGTVYDQRGDPMPDVPVMAWEVRTSLAGERTLDYPPAGSEWVTTDDRGRYRIYGLPPGVYTVGTAWHFHGLGFAARAATESELRLAFDPAATAPGAGRAGGAPDPSVADPVRYDYAPVFTPGMADPLSAETFALRAGEERLGVDLRMRLEPLAQIEGAIVGPDDAIRSVRVSLSRRGPVQALNTSRVWGGTTDGRIGSGAISPGRYSLGAEVAARGDQPAMWAAADIVAVAGETIHVTLRLEPAPSVTGRLIFDGASLSPPKELSRVSLLLWAAGGGGSNSSTAIDPSGTFAITGVIPGAYVVMASVPAGAMPGATPNARWTLKSVVVDGQDVTDRAFEVPPSGASDVVVTFTDRVSELAGTITGPSGAPATDYFVVVIPEDRAYWVPQTRRILSTRPDGSGRYVFRGLPAGTYRVALTTDLVPRDLQERTALERLLKQSAAVTIGDAEQREFNLRAG